MPQAGLDIVSNKRAFDILAQKDQALNLTCYASVGCNDIGYDIDFHTNLSSSDYKVVMNVPDRSICLQNFNEFTNFTKTMIIPRVNVNGSMVYCDIKFGPELSTESSKYHVYFSGS